MSNEIYEQEATLKKVASVGESNKKGFVLKKDKYEIQGAGISGLIYIDPLVIKDMEGTDVLVFMKKVTSQARAKAQTSGPRVSSRASRKQ